MKATLNLENDYGFVLDMDISDKANPSVTVYDFEGNHIGGGGGGDFSTTTLTVTSNNLSCISVEIIEGIMYSTNGYMLGEHTVPLYKGHLYFDLLNDYVDPVVINCSGDITFDEDEGVFDIFGIGTVDVTFEE